jgi:hypothetical protein
MLFKPMIKKLLLVLFILNCSFAYSQTIKTDILVIGGGSGGTSAAIQGARSKLKTLLIDQGPTLNPTMTAQTTVTVNTAHNLPAGTWGELRKRLKELYSKTSGYDTTFTAPVRFEPFTAAAILKKITDTVKNLTVKLNSPVIAIKKDGDGWAITINPEGNSQVIKAKVLIDATANASIAEKAGINFNPYDFASGSQPSTYRTSIATGENPALQPAGNSSNYPQLPAYCIPLNAIVAKGTSNLIVIGTFFPNDDIQYLPNQLALGQGAGTAAAFCAFFKTTTAKLNVRTAQGELLDFKGELLPFTDIANDRYLRAIQQVGATGLLKGMQKPGSGDLLFMPDSAVNTADIEPVLNDIYSRTFLWFNREKPKAQFTVENTLSLISEITLTDPKTLHISMAKNWKAQYKFNSDFDVNRPVSRREFAILINQFLNPFARTVDMAGRFVN